MYSSCAECVSFYHSTAAKLDEDPYHIERDDILEGDLPMNLVRTADGPPNWLPLCLTSPALYFSTSTLYTPSGVPPVGRPRTKRCAGVGAKWLIRSTM